MSKKFKSVLSTLKSSLRINLAIQVVEENALKSVDVEFVSVVQLMPRIALKRDNNLVGSLS